MVEVLNLIINGLPSIPQITPVAFKFIKRFKPYYKWITFNTPYQRDECRIYVRKKSFLYGGKI